MEEEAALINTNKKRSRSYKKVSNEKRLEVIELVEQKLSFREVSRRLNIKHENIRAIYQVYLSQNRMTRVEKRGQKK